MAEHQTQRWNKRLLVYADALLALCGLLAIAFMIFKVIAFSWLLAKEMVHGSMPGMLRSLIMVVAHGWLLDAILALGYERRSRAYWIGAAVCAIVLIVVELRL